MDTNKQDHYFLQPGPLSPLIERFAVDLADQGYSALTISGYTAAARHFAAWLFSAGISVAAIGDDVIHRFAEHGCECPGGRRWKCISPKYWRRARRFYTFLQQTGVVRVAPKVKSAYPLLDDYQTWLRVHRGLSARTITRHLYHLRKLVPELGTETGAYNATLVRDVVREYSERTGPADLRSITSALRCYLRFLAGSGLCPPNLDHAISPVVQWRLSSLPRYIGTADVDRAISSCDQLTRGRRRDKAILLLLARLGLRAGDVAGLRLSDVDWASGTLRLSGKARREVRMPLPQDVGDALIAYIEQERPRVDREEVFLMMVAPYRSFSQSSHVSAIVAIALKRAGISDPPSKGAGLLRHSAATAMLRSGATLEAVGTLLHHRSLDTTAHYAKVDIPMLEQVAQPWPGELTC